MAIRIALIAVGGKGSRMGRSDVQKCLIPIEGKPILEYAIDSLVTSGIKCIILLTGHLHAQVSAYLASRAPQGECVLGSVYGGTEGETQAICRLRPFLQEDFLYTVGDCIFPTETFAEVIAEGERHPASAAVMCVSARRGVAPTHSRVITSRSRRAQKVIPATTKSSARLITMGVYVFRPLAFDFLAKVPPHGHVSAFVPHAIAAGQHTGVSVVRGPWFCFHTEEDIGRWSSSPLKRFLNL